MASLERIYRLVVDAQQATRQLRNISQQVEGFGNQARAMGTALKTSLGGFAAGFTIDAVVDAVREAIEAFDELGKTADRIGLTTTSLQELQFAAEASGLSADELNDSMKEFAKGIGELRLETGPLYSALKDTDAALVDMLKAAKDQDQALDIFADKMQQAGDATERVRLANAAFGGGGIKMVNVLKDGAKGLDDFRNAANATGTVIEEQLIRRAETMNDKWSQFSKKFKNDLNRDLVTMANQISNILGNYNSSDDIANRLNEVMVRLRELQELEKNNTYGYQSGRKKMIKELEEEKKSLEALYAPYQKAAQARKEAEEAAKNPPDVPFVLKGVGGIADYIANAMAVANGEIKTFDAKMKEVGKNISETTGKAKSASDALKAEGAALTAATLTPNEELEKSLARIQYLYEQGVISYTTLVRAQDEAIEKSNKDLDELDKKADETKNTLQEFIEDVQGGIIKWSQESTEAIIDFASGAKRSFGDLAESIIADLAKMAVQARITGPLFDFLGGLFKKPGGTAGNTGGSVDVDSAHGNVFGPYGLMPFARGGVVTSPTVFPFAGGVGLMGEAGAEAILPLQRDSRGNLGVTGGSTVVNITNQSGGEVTTQEGRRSDGTREVNILIESAVEKAFANGRMDKVMGNAFGMRRRGA